MVAFEVLDTLPAGLDGSVKSTSEILQSESPTVVIELAAEYMVAELPVDDEPVLDLDLGPELALALLLVAVISAERTRFSSRTRISLGFGV